MNKRSTTKITQLIGSLLILLSSSPLTGCMAEVSELKATNAVAHPYVEAPYIGDTTEDAFFGDDFPTYLVLSRQVLRIVPFKASPTDTTGEAFEIVSAAPEGNKVSYVIGANSNFGDLFVAGLNVKEDTEEGEYRTRFVLKSASGIEKTIFVETRPNGDFTHLGNPAPFFLSKQVHPDDDSSQSAGRVFEEFMDHIEKTTGQRTWSWEANSANGILASFEEASLSMSEDTYGPASYPHLAFLPNLKKIGLWIFDSSGDVNLFGIHPGTDFRMIAIRESSVTVHGLEQAKELNHLEIDNKDYLDNIIRPAPLFKQSTLCVDSLVVTGNFVPFWELGSKHLHATAPNIQIAKSVLNATTLDFYGRGELAIFEGTACEMGMESATFDVQGLSRNEALEFRTEALTIVKNARCNYHRRSQQPYGEYESVRVTVKQAGDPMADESSDEGKGQVSLEINAETCAAEKE